MQDCLHIKVFSVEGLRADTQSRLNGLIKKKKAFVSSFEDQNTQVIVQLSFKRYIYDPHKKMIQT